MPWGVCLVGAPWPQPGRTVSLGTVTCHPSGGFCDVSSVLDTSNSWLSRQRRGNRGVTAPAWAASSGQHDVTEVALGRDAQRAREPVPTPPAVPGDGSSIADGATWIPGSAVDRHRSDGLSRPLPSGACDVRHEAPEPTTSSFGAAEPGVAGEGTVSAPCFFQAFPLLRSPHFAGLGGDVACQVSLWRPVLNTFPWGGPFTCHSPERVVSQIGPR